MTASRFRSNLRMLTFLVAFSAVVVAVYVRSVRLVERERSENGGKPLGLTMPDCTRRANKAIPLQLDQRSQPFRVTHDDVSGWSVVGGKAVAAKARPGRLKPTLQEDESMG